jgi:hypothetical protein
MDIHEGEPLLSGASARSRTVPHDERRLFTLFLLGIATAALVTFGGTYAGTYRRLMPTGGHHAKIVHYIHLQ